VRNEVDDDHIGVPAPQPYRPHGWWLIYVVGLSASLLYVILSLGPGIILFALIVLAFMLPIILPLALLRARVKPAPAGKKSDLLPATWGGRVVGGGFNTTETLMENESVRHVVIASYSRGPLTASSGHLTITDRRLIFTGSRFGAGIGVPPFRMTRLLR
jgi:hypothetical protein